MISLTAQSGEMEPSMNRHIACLLNSSNVSRKLPRFTLFRNTSALRATALARRIVLPLPDSTRVICAFVWSCMLACCLISAPTLAQNNPCCGAHAGMGCVNQECNDTVCLLDPFCCSIAWDERCALEAGVLCQTCRATAECEVPIPDLDEMTMCENDLPQDCENLQDVRALIPNLKLGGQTHRNCSALKCGPRARLGWRLLMTSAHRPRSRRAWMVALLSHACACPPVLLGLRCDQYCLKIFRAKTIVRATPFKPVFRLARPND